MARNTHKLTDLKIRRLIEKGLHGDGGNLFLKVSPTGSKSWVFRYKKGKRADGKKKVYDLGIGTYPELSLAGARAKAAEFRAHLAAGTNPADVRRNDPEGLAEQPEAKHTVTFAEAVDRFLAAKEEGWRNAKHRQQWRNTLDTYAAPIIGKMDVAEITTDDVLRILEPIWTTKPETASRLRGRIENTLDWCKVRKLRSGENPASWRGHLAHLLPARKKARTVRHHPALPWRDMPTFMQELRANNSMSARALNFTILTCARTGEAIEAEWQEIFTEIGVWVVPKERMKAIREHRVPLSSAALALLADLPRLDGLTYLFHGARLGRPLSNMAMLELLRGMRPGLTVHGFRSTFRDWVAEATSFPRELAEAALAHIIGNATERAYQRGDLFEKRRELMEAWAAFCGSPSAR